MSEPDSNYLDETVASVRSHLLNFAPDYEGRGLRVVDLLVEGPRDAPELVLYITHVRVEGERVLHWPLLDEGRLMGSGDVGMSVGLWAFESTEGLIARLPPSQR
jgi:hypothetical protein